MINCVIVDDEPLAIEVLKRYIENMPELVLLQSFQNPLEAMEMLKEQKVDLLFLDIQMPGITGIEFIKTFEVSIPTIITSAYSDFAVEGFDLNVVDFLVKPIPFDRFVKAINKFSRSVLPETSAANNEKDGYEEEYIYLKVDKSMVKVNYQDIYYVEGLKNYVRFKTNGKDLVTYHSLTYMEDKLPAKYFKRVHKSFIVNITKIDRYTSDGVEMNGKVISVGKTYQDEVEQIIKKRLL
jgi:two-component system, LytTR family, response regulator LytT